MWENVAITQQKFIQPQGKKEIMIFLSGKWVGLEIILNDTYCNTLPYVDPRF